MQTRIAWSNDGLRWNDQTENPAFCGRSDTHNNIVYNPERNVFMIYRRATVNAHELRRIAYRQSHDLVAWPQPQVILDANELDSPMLYGMGVTRYHGVHWGFLQMYYGNNAGYKTGRRLWRDGRVKKLAQSDIELAWSRDGIHWQRHPQRPVFLPTGVPLTDPDWGVVYLNQGIIERDDQLYLYYRGDKVLHFQPGGTSTFNLATLRRDGFVLRGTPEDGADPSYLFTRPLRCPGGKLHITAKAATDGFVRVAVRAAAAADDDGDWLDGWNYQHGEPVTGDTPDTTPVWHDQTSFNPLKGRSVRLHFWLYKAELYSLWFKEKCV